MALIGLDYSSTGIKQNTQQLQALFYPNPVSDIVTVSLSELGDYSLTIYSPLGQVLLEHIFEGNTSGKIHIAHLKPGAYPIRISNSNGDFYSAIILKQ